MADTHKKDLTAFTADRAFRGKGPLSVALVITQHARKYGLPLDPEKLVTEGAGAAGVAAIRSNVERFRGKRVGTLLCSRSMA